MSERADRLAEMPSLAELPREELEYVGGLMEEVTFEAGQKLIGHGEPADECYFIVSGRAEITVGGTPQATVGPGEPVGEMALLLGRDRTATVTATEPVRAFILRAADLDREPDVRQALKRVLLERARRDGLIP
jgi:CRP-like cAMP-binding protein